MNTVTASERMLEELVHPSPPPTPTRPLDRAAMRVGLWLLYWSTRRSRRIVSGEAADRAQRADALRAQYDREAASAALAATLRIR